MKCYIASRMQNAHLVKSLALKIRTIVPQWEFTHHWPDAEWSPTSRLPDHLRRGVAEQDLRDVDAAELVILLSIDSEEVWQGGMHFEVGYAYASGHDVVVIGPRCNVFHHLRDVRHFNTIQDFLADLQSYEADIQNGELFDSVRP